MSHLMLSQSGGKWRVLYRQQPLCADTTADRALELYRRRGGSFPARCWQGDAGVVLELDSDGAILGQEVSA